MFTSACRPICGTPRGRQRLTSSVLFNQGTNRRCLIPHVTPQKPSVRWSIRYYTSASANGLEELKLPAHLRITALETQISLESTLEALVPYSSPGYPAESSGSQIADQQVFGFDAEWNISRKVGVSIIQLAPAALPNDVFIIPVYRWAKWDRPLPPSLIRLLLSPNILKVGSHIKGDFTRLKKQFPTQLRVDEPPAGLVDLKQLCIQAGIIEKSRLQSGTLDALVAKVLGKYLPKEGSVRMCEDWEQQVLRRDLMEYASLDVYASRLVYEAARRQQPTATCSWGFGA
ncbi:ribonuclease H-like domain-containing protein [Coprinopsis sp. MPI-PUGE-AT-0042]|nr:ribonuclease H-like domain-containing protein [Coprinopsis sp. MPI-PUGE-AT-0042]